MTEEQFSKILQEELGKMDKLVGEHIDFRTPFEDAKWKVYSDDTPEQVRSYIRSNILNAFKKQASMELAGNHGEKIETMWRDAIKEFSDSDSFDVPKAFGRKDGEPLGGLTDDDYRLTAVMNGMSEKELRRRVDEYRKEKQGDIAQGASEDTQAEIQAAPYRMAEDFRNGKYDDQATAFGVKLPKVVGEAARAAYSFLRPMTSQAYEKQIAEKSGDDSVFESLSPTTPRGRANMVETSMDALTGANLAGRAATRILPEKLSGVGRKRVMAAASAPYAVGPLQDAAIDAAGQGILAATDDREFDPNQTANVIGSSATFPTLAASLTTPLLQGAGAPRQFARDFQQGLRKGESNRANEVMKLAEANEKGRKLRKDFDDPKLSMTERNRAAELDKRNRERIEGEFPTLEGIYGAEDWKALTGGIDFGKEVAENKSLAAHAKGIENPEHFTDAEYTLFDANYREPPVGAVGKAGSVLGTLVSPASQQLARASTVEDNGQDYRKTPWYQKLSAENRKKVDERMKKEREK